jgi:UDP-2,3-diacylglucosamine pyrophosphatase LpxH
MMSRPRELAGFIEGLSARVADDETLELVVAGDCVDFLAIPPFAAWTVEREAASGKLARTMNAQPFAQVFDALARHVAGGHRLTILIGNHDVELALPHVQEEFLTRLQATNHDVLFFDDNRAYRVGRLLIEHGNRYDGANENDWTGLRAIGSALSRNETPCDELEPSAGSRLVEKIISPLKSMGYPFIDLLQPQGELVALLLVAFEPSILLDLPKIGRILRAKKLQAKNAKGLQPGETRHVSFRPHTREDQQLLAAFGSAYTTLRTADEHVGLGDLIMTGWQARNESLSTLLELGESIPPARLEQIRVVMNKLLLGDTSLAIDGDTEQYGEAAKRLIAQSKGEIEVVVMGHTHLARQLGSAERGTYINTGTWADVIRVPNGALADGGGPELERFLMGLRAGEYRTCPATCASLRVEANGTVSEARLLSEQLP